MNRGRRRVAIVALAATLASTAAAALAGTTGTIEGRVSDNRGNGLQGAVVSLHGEVQTAQTRSDAHGHFHFLSVYPDRYYIVFNRSGHHVTTLWVSVHADQVTTCNAHLLPALTGIYHTHVRGNAVVPCAF